MCMLIARIDVNSINILGGPKITLDRIKMRRCIQDFFLILFFFFYMLVYRFKSHFAD